MDHHDWQWSADDDGGHSDAETADLSGGDDLGHGEGFTDFGDHDLGGDQDLGGHDLGGHDDLGGQHELRPDSLDEPLGTENAAATYDADVADHGDFDEHGAGYSHDDDQGQDPPGVPSGGAPGDHDAALTSGHDLGADPSSHGTDPDAHGADLSSHGTEPGSHDPQTDDHGAGAAADPDAHDGAVPGDHHHDVAPGDHDGQPDPAADHADGHAYEVNDGHGDATGDHLVGVDPDLDHRADDPGWHDDPFPPELHLDATPEPVDGFPWIDPASLGGHDVDDYTHSPAGAESLDLAHYSGIDIPDGTDPWTALFGSEDPATSSLAQWWAPRG